jgi:hypothetical protein
MLKPSLGYLITDSVLDIKSLTLGYSCHNFIQGINNKTSKQTQGLLKKGTDFPQ